MTGVESILEQLRLLVVQHAPSEALSRAVPFALLCLVAGVGFSVLGAKLARFGFVLACSGLGGAVGVFVARATGYQPVLFALVGALMAGVVGYHTFRFWVGIGAAVVLSSIALGLFGYRHVVPHVEEFNASTSLTAEAPETFVLPTPGQQRAYVDRTPREWVAGLWAYVTQQDAQLEGKARAVALAAILTGLCLGVVAVRSALIVSTSLVGTGLVTTGLATLLTESVPASFHAFQQRPGLVGVGVGAFLVTSLIVQTLLTRRAPTDAEPAPSKKS